MEDSVICSEIQIPQDFYHYDFEVTKIINGEDLDQFLTKFRIEHEELAKSERFDDFILFLKSVDLKIKNIVIFPYGLAIGQKDKSEITSISEGQITITRTVEHKAPMSCAWGQNAFAFQIKKSFKGKISLILNSEYIQTAEI